MGEKKKISLGSFLFLFFNKFLNGAEIYFPQNNFNIDQYLKKLKFL